MEIKEAEWDPALIQPPPADSPDIAQFTAHITFLNGLLTQIGPNLHLLWQELTQVGVIVTASRVDVVNCLRDTLGVTISDDLSATLVHSGTPGFQPVKTLVNLLRHIKVLER